MFGISSYELLVIAVVFFLFLGPKDFPKMLYAVGKFFRVVKRHFTKLRLQFEDMMEEMELEEIKKKAEAMARKRETDLNKNLKTPLKKTPKKHG